MEFSYLLAESSKYSFILYPEARAYKGGQKHIILIEARI